MFVGKHRRSLCFFINFGRPTLIAEKPIAFFFLINFFLILTINIFLYKIVVN